MERQKMNDMIVYIILALMALANMIIYRYYLMQDLSFFYLSVISILFFMLISKVLYLKVRIGADGVFYRFFPFHIKEKLIRWDTVESFEIVSFRPLRDYGGYGIRFNMSSKAYIISGHKGLKIYWKNDRKPWVIGIQQEDKIKEALSFFAPEINIKDTLWKKN